MAGEHFFLPVLSVAQNYRGVCCCFYTADIGALHIFYIVVEKNIPKLQEEMQKRGKIPCHQNNSNQKNDRGRANHPLIEFFIVGIFLVMFIFSNFVVFFTLTLYYSVFKRARMSFPLRKALKSL